MIYKVYVQGILVVIDAGYVSDRLMSKMILYYVCVNAQDRLNGYIFCAWRIGLLITSKKERMIIASFIPIMRQIVNCANTVYLISSSMKVGCTRF